MKRLAIGFGIAGGVALLVALVSGFVPVTSGDCTGSFFTPMRGSGWDSDSENVSLSLLCNANGYPGFFWTFTIIGVALLVAAVVFQQIGAHQASVSPRAPRPTRATVVVAATPPPFQPAPQFQATPRPIPASVASELKSLKDLYDAGGLTADEFAAAKARVLRGPSAT